MNDLIVGLGEVGKAVQEAVCPKAKVYDINQKNTRIGRVNFMHICFPYDENFVHNVQEYMIWFEPKHVVIWSTVDIGTCKKIAKEVLHSPIEGVHPNLAESIKKMTRWIGYNLLDEYKTFALYCSEREIIVKGIRNTNHTEALKLLSTTEYGINIAFADYKAKIAKTIKMPYELTKEWNKDYNKLYQDLNMSKYQKYILDPPEGSIGGHCILPNIDILSKKYNHKILDVIKEVGNDNI